MAAPYCTLTGTIPGGENGRALVRIVPDVIGATATIDGASVSMREHIVRTDQAGAVNIEVLAPGAGVSPSGSWTHTIYIDSSKVDIVKHVVLTQGATIDIMLANAVDEISPLPFGGGGGGGGIAELPSYLAESALRNTYLSKSSAAITYYTKQEVNIGLRSKADNDAILNIQRYVNKNLNPFKPGSRYYSPVTYYWPDYYNDGKPGKISKWAETLKFRDQLGFVILNRNSGDWEDYDKDFKKQGELALGAGAKRVLFYVKTQYGIASLPANDPLKKTVPDPNKYTKEYIMSQIAHAKTHYGDLVQGVFLDEMINGWENSASREQWYRELFHQIRTLYSTNFQIVVNTGTNISESICKLDFDTCMMFEGTAEKFLEENAQSPVFPAHMAEYPSTRWWATIHTTTEFNYKQVFAKADRLGIGHLYITDGVLVEDPNHGGQWEPVGNPYENPPSKHILDLVIPWLKGFLPLQQTVDDLPKTLAPIPLQAGRFVPTVGFFGDSWSTEATMGQGFNMPAAASRILNCAPMVSAVDGSGFGHSASGNDNFEADYRINTVCAAVPNLIVTVGSLNSDKVIDNGDADGTAITEAVKSFVTKVRKKLPNVPIVMVGPEPSAVSRLLSKSGHVNVKAQKAGVEAAGGLANGIAFVDWLGVADKQAVLWRDGRACAEGDIVVYRGVAYKVTKTWVPLSGITPLSEGAPVVQVSDVLSGTGNVDRPQGDGTRDIMMQSDDTHPTKIGSTAFGSALAYRIASAVQELAPWMKKQGAVIAAPGPATPPSPTPAALPIMAWLQKGWDNPNRIAYTLDEIKAIANLGIGQVALPIQSTADATDSAVAIPSNYKDGKSFSDYSLDTIRRDGVNVSGMFEALDALEAKNIAVLPNILNGLLDADAKWYRSSDGKLLPLLSARKKLYFTIHYRAQNKLREIMKTDYPGFKRVVDSTDGPADWQISDVKNAQLGVLPAGMTGEAWRQVKNTYPEGVWVLVSSKDEQVTAEASAKNINVKIIGWAVATPEAFAAIK